MLDNSELRTYKKFHACSQIRDANELLARIEEDGIGKQEIVVDIGCRSGAITKMLATTVEHDIIYGIDNSPKMIEFAEQNNKIDSIQYSVQKIDVPWHELSPMLRNLEGTVDLVWSNRILHWVRDKATAIKNITRLMKPGGRFYSNITMMRDIYEWMSEEEREENEKFVKCVTHEQQLKNWSNSFIAAGLSRQIKIETLHKEWTFETSQHIQGLYSIVEPCVLNSMPKTIPEQEKINACLRVKDLLTRTSQTKFGENPANSIDPDNRIIYYGQFRIVAMK